MITFEEYSRLSESDWEQRIISYTNQLFDQEHLQLLYRKILSFIDLTTLEGSDNRLKAGNLCQQALSVSNTEKQVPAVAAVCVYPTFVRHCKKILDGSSIKVASVAGAFPSGQSPIDIKISEISYAVAEGADEIDMVISRGTFLEGDYQTVSDEISAIKKACGKAHLKVILETGELQTVENIRKASEISIISGGDFIKTSTGKIQPAATEKAAIIMCDTIKEYYDKTGIKIGFKPAGGIAEPSVALRYYSIVENILGEEWLVPDLFRIGASRLVNNLLSKIE